MCRLLAPIQQPSWYRHSFRLPGNRKAFKAGDHSATKKGLLLKEVTGYGIDPVSGNFSGGASGFWIENGEIVAPVKGITIAGRAFDILAMIDMMGNDIDMSRSFAALTIRIAKMQIGGK